jgi:hypothetical protein
MAEASSHRHHDLIGLLVADLTPIRRGAVARCIALGVGSGSLIALAAVLLLWGPRPDWGQAVSEPAFWLKTGFTVALGAAGFMSLLRLARPDGAAPGAAAAVVLTVLAMGLAAVRQLILSAPDLRQSLLMGSTSAVCPWLIIVLSIPVLWGTLTALRVMAPTRLRLTGAAAGLTSGALSAFVYSVSCDERALAFVFVWYGLAIAAVSMAGAVIGPRVLRW